MASLIYDFKATLVILSIISHFTSIECVAQLPDCGIKKVKNYIVNGEDALPNEFPFIVLIKLNGNTVCGGAVLNHWWVITAAHCFKGRENQMSAYTLHLGSDTIDDGEVYSLSKIVVHEKFTFDTMNSDVTVVRTDRQIVFGPKVGSICLPYPKYGESHGVLTAAGWGRLYAGGPPSKKLQKINLPIITDQECSNRYADKRVMVFRSNLCTFLSGHDTCEGDSGGPGFQYHKGRAVLLGVVSFGWECADEHPGAFTQISYFIDWIEKNAQE